MGQIFTSEKYIEFTMRDELLRIEAYGENCIRVRSTRNSRLSEERWQTDVQICAEENSASLQTGMLKAVIFKGWRSYDLVFYKNGQEILRTVNEGDSINKFSHTEGDN